MCGISGTISLNNRPLEYSELVDMTDELKDRGPDNEGYLISNNLGFTNSLQHRKAEADVIALQHFQHFGFGHRRLSTTDLSTAASQPMTEASKRYWIVYNGQIYNHPELRNELTALGHTFITDHSDTEVILNAYKQWGTDCLLRFNGMWALCIWDSIENTFFISRDRMGKQPVYYTTYNDTFYFASELNALLTNKKINRTLNEFAVYDYLTYTNVPAPETIVKDLKKLPAAHFLIFKPGEPVIIKKYWDPVKNLPNHTLSEKQIIEGIRDRIYESTCVRMKADVEVGMFLSGGLDSSINLACMSKFNPKPIKAYTVGFENKNGYKNEFEYARKVANYFKADLTELIVGEKEFFEGLSDIAYLQDEPIADTANIPVYFISQVAQKDGLKILLSGEGSDELFIGYEHWRLINEYERIFRNRPVLASSFAFLHKNSGFKNRRPYYHTWAYKIKNNWPVFWGGTELRTEAQKHAILSPDFTERIGSYHSFMPIKELYDSFSSKKTYDTLEWMTINDLQNRLPDQLLARLDRMMMASSVEGRNPFLDVNLIEYVLRIPSHLKIKHKTEKYLLKKAFEGIVPREIIYRAKDSFTVPLQVMFNNISRKKEYMDIIKQFNAEQGIFMESYLKQLESPKKIQEFWNVLNLAMWYNCHK